MTVNPASTPAVLHRIVLLHTLSIKATRLLLLIVVPVVFLTLSMIPAITGVATATFAAIEEGHLIRTVTNTL